MTDEGIGYRKGNPEVLKNRAGKEHGGMYGTAGIPDIICCYRGRFYGFEVKTEDGEPTRLQEATIRKIQKAGGTALVVRSVDEVRAVIDGSLQ